MPEGRMRVERVVDTVFQENAYVVFEKPGGRCWIIDPSFEPQPRRIASLIDEHSLTPAAILITHCHGDHIAGIDALVDRWPRIDLYVPAAEADWLVDARKNLSAGFGMTATGFAGLAGAGRQRALAGRRGVLLPGRQGVVCRRRAVCRLDRPDRSCRLERAAVAG
jgi:glyoxylase-like metal-dependent hydrolase (beta-lactamase superfamily II)